MERIENLVLRASRRSRRRGLEITSSAIGQICQRFQVSAPPLAKKTAGLIEKETEVSYDLILFVLVLVLVLEIRNL